MDLFRSSVLAAGLGISLPLSASADAASTLGSYNVNPNTVTVAGVSSGGFMAVQLQVAYSKSIFGTAVIAGGAYYCAQGDITVALGACSTGIGVSVPPLVSYSNSQASAGYIDPTSNIGGKPIYMFSGALDSVDHQLTMDDLYTYYESFTTKGKITYNKNTDAEHSWVTPDGANPCDLLLAPFLNNCGIDVEQTFLSLFYGTLNARNNGKLGGSFVQFDQNPYCPKGNCRAIDMDSTAWVFVPRNCATLEACRIVITLHGCLSNQQTIGTAFIKGSGINEWADTNNIIVVYPQAIASITPLNEFGCWDWWGYTNSNYALKGAPQMSAIMNEVNQLTGGKEQYLAK
jgi:poly(3-hydroxybutyrate) depolymerase